MNRIISGSVTLKWYECYHNAIKTKLLIVFLFLVFILSILFPIKPYNFKNVILEFSKKKHDQTLLISLINLSLSSNFWITLGLMKSNGCVVLLNILHYILSLMWKKLWKCIFRASRKVRFSYFLKTALDHDGGCPLWWGMTF